jgi:hypothetical protein
MRYILLIVVVLITLFGCVLITSTPVASNDFNFEVIATNQQPLLSLRNLEIYSRNLELVIEELEFYDLEALDHFFEGLDLSLGKLELIREQLEPKASIGFVGVRRNAEDDKKNDVAIDLGFIVLHKDDTWQIILLAMSIFIAIYILKLELDHFYIKRQERYKKKLEG